jgi:hypothetical protein
MMLSPGLEVEIVKPNSPLHGKVGTVEAVDRLLVHVKVDRKVVAVSIEEVSATAPPAGPLAALFGFNPEFVSGHCNRGMHGVCLRLYGGNVCACTCGHPMVANGPPKPASRGAHRRDLPVGPLHLKILDALRRRAGDGMTAAQLERVLVVPGSSLRPRLIELRGDDPKRRCDPPLIERAYETRTATSGRPAARVPVRRSTPSGRRAEVYVITPAGIERLDEKR